MTREEMMRLAAAKERSVSQERAFIRGAVWADEHCWIDVNEELPPYGVSVIVCDNKRLELEAWFSHRTESDVIKDKNDYVIMYEPIEVTHWMPLPQPPKKGVEE